MRGGRVYAEATRSTASVGETLTVSCWLADAFPTTPTRPPAPLLIHLFEIASFAMPENLESWTITLDFASDTPTRAQYIGLDIVRRLAGVVPGYDKNSVAIRREAGRGDAVPLFCDRDIYCHRFLGHGGSCVDHDGSALDGC